MPARAWCVGHGIDPVKNPSSCPKAEIFFILLFESICKYLIKIQHYSIVVSSMCCLTQSTANEPPGICVPKQRVLLKKGKGMENTG